MKKTIERTENVLAFLILVASCMLLGVTLARREIEHRVLEEQQVYVVKDTIYVLYKGEVHTHFIDN